MVGSEVGAGKFLTLHFVFRLIASLARSKRRLIIWIRVYTSVLQGGECVTKHHCKITELLCALSLVDRCLDESM